MTDQGFYDEGQTGEAAKTEGMQAQSTS